MNSLAPASRLAILILLPIVGLMGVTPRVSCAQELRGVIRDSASNLPIAGAVVTIQETRRSKGAHAVTNERGEFRISIGRDAHRIVIVRLGFRPLDAFVPEASGGSVRADFAMTALARLIAPVRVHVNPLCPKRNDGLIAGGLLEQARAGLLAMVVFRAERSANLKRIRFKRLLDAESDTIIWQDIRVDSGDGSQSFTSARNAEEFLGKGFMRESAGRATFFAPDAEVLLDDGFTDGYCFRIMDPHPSRQNQVGLGFRAASAKPPRIDVDGALWIDTLRRALKDIEFSYTGLPRSYEPYRPGGHVWFHEPENGVVLIHRYVLRLIAEVAESAFKTPRNDVKIHSTETQPVRRLTPQESGGEVVRAAWDNGSTWRAPLGTILLTALTRDGAPAHGLTLRMPRTDYIGTTDRQGDVEFTDLLSGPYTFALVDPRLHPIGLEIVQSLRVNVIADSVMRRTFTVRTAEDSVLARCGQSGLARSLVVGRVRMSDGSTPDRVGIVMQKALPGGPPQALRGKGGLSAGGGPDVVGEIGGDGLFQACDFKEGDSILIETSRDGITKRITTAPLSRGLNVLPTLILDRKP